MAASLDAGLGGSGSEDSDVPSNLHSISFLENRLIHRPDADLAFIDARKQGGRRYVSCYIGGITSVYDFDEVVALVKRLGIPQSRILFAPDMSQPWAEQEMRLLADEEHS